MVPDDFVRFVARHGPRIARACAEIVGHDQVADALRNTLLVDVAGRWRRWPDGSRTERALVRLEQLLQREARTQHVDVHPAALDLRSALVLRTTAEEAEPDDEARSLAARVWPRVALARRMRWAGLGIVALVALAAVLLAPDPPTPLPTHVPEDVTVLPAFDDLVEIEQPGFLPLPPLVFLDPASVDRLPVLTGAPLEFAVVVAAASGERLVVAGFEHGIGPREFRPPSRPLHRRVAHPALRGARLLPTSLSPDGTTVALVKGGDLILVDVRTGIVRGLDVRATQPETPVLAWLDSSRIILPGIDGSLVVDTTTDEVRGVDINPVDVLTMRGYQEPRLAHLVPIQGTPATEGPHTIRSVLEYWRPMDSTGSVEPVAGAGQVAIRRIVTGPPWLSTWTGPGWASGLRIVRRCDPATLLLPADVGPASAAIAAMNAYGDYIATLVATGDTRIESLGYLGQETALVSVRVDGRSLVAAWDPATNSLGTVIVLNADAPVSVADLLRPLGPPVVPPDQENADTPVSASPTMS